MTVKYTSDHEWIQLEDHEAAVVGITLHAQDALGDVVFVDLPEIGKVLKKGEQAGVVESVKAAADVYMHSSSTEKGDIASCYANGANSYVRKATDFDELRRKMRQVYDFWITVNERSRTEL